MILDEGLSRYIYDHLAPRSTGDCPDLQQGWLDSKSASLLPEAREFVRSVLGHSANLEAVFGPITPWTCYATECESQEWSVQTFTHLPDVRIVKSCVAVYYSTSVHSILPTIDRDLFINTLNLAYSVPMSDHLGSSSAKACVWAFLCLSSIWGPAVAFKPQTNVTAIAMEVERYIPRILQQGTIDGLQALIMLVCMQYHQNCVQNLFPLHGLGLDALSLFLRELSGCTPSGLSH